MKKIWTSILIVVFGFYGLSGNIFAGPADHQLMEQGIGYYNNAYFEKAVDVLQTALAGGLDREGQVQTHFYIALSSIALNRLSDARDHFQQLIELDPEFTLNEVDYPPDVVRQFREVRENYPVIYDFASLPAEFYPYRGDKPYFQFRITASDRVTMKLTSGYSTFFKETESFQDHRQNRHYWQWQDRMIETSETEISVSPNKNEKTYEFSRRLVLQVEKPTDLVYKDGRLGIEGRTFLPESRTVHIKGKWWQRLLAVAIASAGWTGTYLLFKSGKAGPIIAGLLLTAPIGGAYTYVTIRPEAARGSGSIFTFEDKQIPLENNIKKNNELRAEIDKLKTEVRVKQNSGDSD